MRLLLVRHGQSLGNVEQRIQGSDDPLTDFGRRQATAVGAHLAARGDITHLYASNLDRAIETAMIIGKQIDLEPIPTPGLAEINTGIASGLLWTDWVARNPELASEIEKNSETSPFGVWEGGESGQEFADRVLATFDAIIERHRGTDDVVALVSHGGPLAWIAAKIHGDALDIWPSERGGFLNCSVSELECDTEGNLTVLDWNYVEHLDEITP
jgi:probable phosphoglycerate mutase